MSGAKKEMIYGRYAGVKVTSEVDPETGLPRLPEGQFWFVSRASRKNCNLRVELREYRKWGLPRLVAFLYSAPNERSVTQTAADVLAKVEHAVVTQEVLVEAKRIKRERLAKAKSLEGFYPPRKLGA